MAGKTEELIKNCEFIITRNSTAVTFAAYYKKFVTFIFLPMKARIQKVLEFQMN